MAAFKTSDIKYVILDDSNHYIIDFDNKLATTRTTNRPRWFDNGTAAAKYANAYAKAYQGFVSPAYDDLGFPRIDTYMVQVEPAAYGADLDPTKAVLIELPHSEVNMHMQVAGKGMLVQLQANADGCHSAQLFTCDGRKFSGPITTGEAGLRWDNINNQYYVTLGSVKIKDLK